MTTTALSDGVVSQAGSERSPDAGSRRDFEGVTVTVATRDVATDAVRIAPVPGMRPVIDMRR